MTLLFYSSTYSDKLCSVSNSANSCAEINGAGENRRSSRFVTDVVKSQSDELCEAGQCRDRNVLKLGVIF